MKIELGWLKGRRALRESDICKMISELEDQIKEHYKVENEKIAAVTALCILENLIDQYCFNGGEFEMDYYWFYERYVENVSRYKSWLKKTSRE